MSLAGRVQELLAEGRRAVAPAWERLEPLRLANQRRVLNAFRRAGVGAHHLIGASGYGYGDASREAVEEVFALAMGAESALVRPQLASGTHAIYACLRGLLRPGDRLVSATGKPYDTLHKAIVGPAPSHLAGSGVVYDETPWRAGEPMPDLAALKKTLDKSGAKVVLIQRSRGYERRPALRLEQIAEIVETVRSSAPDAVVMVDNCYGEFTEEAEPLAAGADLLAGSLIKNPGGTLAPGGGYIAGKEELVAPLAHTLTAPGLGRAVGPMFHLGPMILQGLFQAPHIVAEALQGAILTAWFFERLGFPAWPAWSEQRGDIVQAVGFPDARHVESVCAAVQSASPVDSRALPVPGPLPGYDDPVIMAAGTFVQGGSLEWTADAPMRDPYTVFFQGGICKEHVQLGLEAVGARLAQDGLLSGFP